MNGPNEKKYICSHPNYPKKCMEYLINCHSTLWRKHNIIIIIKCKERENKELRIVSLKTVHILNLERRQMLVQAN